MRKEKLPHICVMQNETNTRSTMTKFQTLLQSWDTETLSDYNEKLTSQRKAYQRENLFTIPQYRNLTSRIVDVRQELHNRKAN